MRIPLSLLPGVTSVATTLLALCHLPASADPLVFVSSFAGGEKGAITAFSFSPEDGSLKELARTGGIENPFFLAVSPDQRFLNAVHAKAFGGKEDEEVASFSIDRESGKLTLLNRQSSKGTATCYLEVDKTGKTLLLANYSSGSVASLPILEDGSLGEAVSFFQHEGGSKVDPKRQNGPYAHSFIISPDNRFAYAADLGLDQIRIYRLDAASAKIEPASPAFVSSPAGAGPRHQAFAPDGKNLYAINELSNSVTRYAHETATGALTKHESLSTLPNDFQGTSYCADLKFTPDGRFLFGTNRGHDSIVMFQMEDTSFSRVGFFPSQGKGPQNLLVTPDGKWLLCANMPGNNLAVFRIESENFRIVPVGAPLEITMPSCIRLLP
ncbi:MAG: lactonase family protein [Verrucomicrobiae bacterium]|nr:lactonase family protein [Verrucomicrobiae bacterium]